MESVLDQLCLVTTLGSRSGAMVYEGEDGDPRPSRGRGAGRDKAPLASFQRDWSLHHEVEGVVTAHSDVILRVERSVSRLPARV